MKMTFSVSKRVIGSFRIETLTGCDVTNLFWRKILHNLTFYYFNSMMKLNVDTIEMSEHYVQLEQRADFRKVPIHHTTCNLGQLKQPRLDLAY